jgi:CRP-like cAMP-binding protein
MISIIMTSLTQMPNPFGQLPPAAIGEIAIGKRQLLFRQGDRPNNLYFLADGALNMQRHTASGQLVTLHRANPGDVIAEVSLYSEQYRCDCIAEKDSLLMSFKKSAVLDLLTKDPDFASALVQRLARQVQRYRRQLELRSIRSAQDRVLAGLSDGWLSGSVLAFSDDLGLTHEATYRALSKLVNMDRVQKTGRGKYQVR